MSAAAQSVGAPRTTSYKRTVIRLLDRPGGRLLLAKAATQFVRHATGEDLEIAYLHGLWTRRAGLHYFPDGPRFGYASGDLREWSRIMDHYEADTTEYWLWRYQPKEGDTVLDIGAGRGEDTATFSRGVGAAGRVIAVEAHPFSFKILKSFCCLNRLENVTAVHLALMDRRGTVRIVDSPDSWLENSIEPNGGTSGQEVQAGTLDDLCAKEGIRQISFLKMNIEGAERAALLGMRQLLPQIRQICVACHDFRAEMGHGEQFRTRTFVAQFLSAQGFEVSSRLEDPRDYVRDHIHGIRRT